jgi:hypothetical protein
MPVHDDMFQLEQELMPSFDIKMQSLSDEFNVKYINAISQRDIYSYTDGHHLDYASGERFSHYLVTQIEDLH